MGGYAQGIGNCDISDHCSIWLLRSSKDWGPKPFCVFNGWFEHKEFKLYVRSCWTDFFISRNKAYIVKENFKLLKEKLRKWYKDVFGRLDLNIESLVMDLNSLDQALYDNLDSAKVLQRNEVSYPFWNEIHLKESFLAQKSKAQWIKEILLKEINFEKAYDSISWDFLLYMMERMGFAAEWIQWMKAHICSSSLSVLVNGSPTNDFIVYRGLK